MVEVRESNLFFAFLHHNKGTKHTEHPLTSIGRRERLDDLFFDYWQSLNDWERYALLEMYERGRSYDFGGRTTRATLHLLYRRYEKITPNTLQQWMVDDVKNLFLSIGRHEQYRKTVPNAYRKWFIVPTHEKVLKSTREFQS